MTTLYIKNMVCNRCKTAVQQECERLGLHPEHIALGELILTELPDTDTLQQLDVSLANLGFERIDDRKARLIERIKSTIIQVIRRDDVIEKKSNWSALLAEQLHHEYNYLSTLFSSLEGVTIEQFIIRQKIEYVKELLFYDELTLSEISHTLGYSSVAHLSAQFKKITGLTPSELKKSGEITQTRKSLDKVS